ncbi:MAG: hypothetical protein ACJ79T_22175 [Myxococcales bacterium]
MKITNRCAVVAILVLAAASAQAAPWTFTKLSAPQPLAAPAQGAETLVFQVGSGSATGASITRMRFQVTGNLPVGSVTTFELVAYPAGRGAPGVIVGTNDGSTWRPNAAKAVFEIPLTTPLAVGPSSVTFALRANVKGGSTFFFNTGLQTVHVSEGGVERFLLDDTEDLPMSGDTLQVN